MSAATTALREHTPRELPAPAPEAPAAPARSGFRQRRSTRVFAGLVALATVGALGAWVFGRGKESTDDAGWLHRHRLDEHHAHQQHPPVPE